MNERILVLFALLIMFIYPASAGFGVSSEYHKANPLYIAAGETEITIIKIYNTLSDSPSKVEVSVIEGEEIARILNPQGIYEISAGEYRDIELQISIPDEGTNVKNVGLLFRAVPDGSGEGNVQFSPNFINSFEVITGSLPGIEPKPEKSGEGIFLSIFYSLLVLMILVMVLIIVVYVRNRNQYEGGSNV